MKYRRVNARARYGLVQFLAGGGLVLALVSCVSVPGPADQAAAIANQRFGADYRFAVTSWYQRADVEFARIESDGQNTTDAGLLASIDAALQAEGVQWGAFDTRYNRLAGPSNIDQRFAAALHNAFGVQTPFVERPAIAKGLPAAPSAMHVARPIADSRGDDAVAVLYFQPLLRVEQLDPEIVPVYRVAFDYHLAARSAPDDRLMYSKEGVATCSPRHEEVTLPSGIAIKRRLSEQYPLCEEEILDLVIEEFLTFARNARAADGMPPR